MKDSNEIESLIVRHLNGTCSESECAGLLEWIELNPQNKSDFLAIKDVWDSARVVKDQADQQLLLFYKNQYEKSKRSRIQIIRWVSSVAAIIIVGLAINILIQNKTVGQPESMQVFSVPLGSKSKLLLADGTEINMNSGSELSYSSNFSPQNRSVTLTGEAFFKVKPDAEHPFLVQTRDFTIRVTGTRLNVCNYNEDNYISATLAEGKIILNIKNCTREIEMKPGEKFLLDRCAKRYTIKPTDIDKELAWKDGEFIFKNIPFPELVKRLERWYDVKLTYTDKKLQTYSYSGRFKNQETIWQVLDAIRMTSPVNYSKTTFREFALTYKSIN
ncbi:MAG: FecR domain-containing protein [Mariniphaga sp.]